MLKTWSSGLSHDQNPGLRPRFWRNTRLLMVPNCYEVVAMVATMVAMVVPLWCKAVSQWLVNFNLCVSVTWPLTCAFHIPCTHTPEIIDMHRGVCDNNITWQAMIKTYKKVHEDTCSYVVRSRYQNTKEYILVFTKNMIIYISCLH